MSCRGSLETCDPAPADAPTAYVLPSSERIVRKVTGNEERQVEDLCDASAGRYLEPEPLGEGQFLVDFNLAYNPYCAYNDDWSCPITPPENRLAVPIRAGEQIYKDT
jgi:hypothetical protein